MTRALHWRLPVAIAAAGALLALAAVLPARAVPAQLPRMATTATAYLTLTGDGESFTLRSDVPALWQVGVTTQSIQLTALLASISASGALVDPPAGAPATTLSLASCRQAWQGSSCPTGAHQLLAATPLTQLTGQRSSLADAQGIPANVFLLATVLMPSGALPLVAGDSATVTIDVTAAGNLIEPAQPGQQGTPPVSQGTPPQPPGLATTGSRVGVLAVLAAAAVGTGVLLAALARRRQRERPPGRAE